MHSWGYNSWRHSKLRYGVQLELCRNTCGGESGKPLRTMSRKLTIQISTQFRYPKDSECKYQCAETHIPRKVINAPTPHLVPRPSHCPVLHTASSNPGHSGKAWERDHIILNVQFVLLFIFFILQTVIKYWRLLSVSSQCSVACVDGGGQM